MEGPFPPPFAEGGITWKLLNVSPEMGSWAAIFDCPKGSSFHTTYSHWTRRVFLDQR